MGVEIYLLPAPFGAKIKLPKAERQIWPTKTEVFM